MASPRKTSVRPISLLFVGGILAATGVTSTQVLLGTPQSVAVSQRGGLRLALSQTVTVTEPGCNSTAFAEVPNRPQLFIGRQQITSEGRLAGVTGPNDCSGGNPKNELIGKPYNRWALVLDSLDWNSRRFSIVRPLIDTSLDPRTGRSRAVVTGGPMKGLIIRSAYDPSAVEFNGQIFVGFECTVENGSRYNVQETSSCIAVYDPESRSIDMSTALVAVSGRRDGDTYYVASVPRLLVFHRRLYLYWAASVIEGGKIIRSAARGAELQLSGGVPSLRGAPNRVATPLDRVSTEVWATEPFSSANLIANIMSFVPLRTSFLMLGVLGGGDCQTPAGTSPGCFRLAVRRSSSPIMPHGFNQAWRQSVDLPTNSNEYPTPIIDPKGNLWLLGHFRRPVVNGYSERAPVPGRQFWKSNQRESVLALIPAQLPDE